MFNTCRAYMLTKIHWHSMSSNNQRNIGSSGSKSWPPCAWQIFPQDQVLVFLCMSLHKAKHPYIAKSYFLKWWKVYMWLIKNCALRKPKYEWSNTKMTFCFNCTVLINKYKRIITQSPDIQVIISTSKSLNLVVNNQVCITGLGAYLQPAIYTFCRPAQEIVCYRPWAL